MSFQHSHQHYKRKMCFPTSLLTILIKKKNPCQLIGKILPAFIEFSVFSFTVRQPCVISWCSKPSRQKQFLSLTPVHFLFFFKNFKDFMDLLLKRREWGEKEGRKTAMCEKYMGTPPTEDLTHNPGICPDCELNWPLSHTKAGTEPHQLGQFSSLILGWNPDNICGVLYQLSTTEILK